MTLRRPLLTLAFASCLAWLAAGAELIRRPYLQNAAPDRVTIFWAARSSVSGSLEYSTSPEFSNPVAVEAVSREFTPMNSRLPYYWQQYRADLAGLKPGTQYYYRVIADGSPLETGESAVSSFRTASSGPFSFFAFGDSGDCSPPQYRLAELMLASPAAFVLHTGDLAYPDATFEQFDSCYFGAYHKLMRRIPFFTTPGNHEYFTDSGFPYFSLHAFPTNGEGPAHEGHFYSFDWGNAHIVSLDTNPFDSDADASVMLRWLDKDLASTSRFWRIVLFHHAVFCSGKHEDDRYHVRLRAELMPILEKHEVHLVLNGHAHSYQRSAALRGGVRQPPGHGTVYVVSGGGGGGLYPVPERSFLEKGISAYHFLQIEVSGGQLQLRAIGDDGAELDQFSLTPPPRVRDGSIVTAGTLSRRIPPGAMINIDGTNFALDEIRSREFPYPTELSGIRVEAGGIPLPLSYVSPTRISALLPPALRGETALRIVTPNGTSEAGIMIEDGHPPIEPDEPDPGKPRRPAGQ